MSERDEASETGSALAAALAATRRTFDGQSERARATERRILESMRGPTRMRRVFWLVPVTAAFVVSGAFAQEIGERLSELGASFLADEDAALAAPSSRASSATRRGPEPPPAPSTAPATSPSVAPAPPGELERTAPAPTSIASTEPPASTVVSPARPTPSASSAATEVPSELAIYKEAHRAHFVSHDYASALAGWERYLTVAPRGTFALEARYNRAIALYRLGRRAAAVEALKPFADGAYGRYRRDEARELIEELR